MIKLNLTPCPTELTDKVKTQLVAEYKATGEAVWKKSYIEKGLLEMTSYKCAYSEQALQANSAYMEIDHYKCKSLYPDEVVTWGNLLPSCKKCNATKHELDVEAEPIVNPLNDIPKDFLYVQGFRYYPRDNSPKGDTTIKVLALNDYFHFVCPRAEIALSIADHMETLFDNLKLLIETGKNVNRTLSKIKSLLESCGPTYVYSAVISTYILYECNLYQQLETFLKEHNYWDSEFESIKSMLLGISLEK